MAPPPNAMARALVLVLLLGACASPEPSEAPASSSALVVGTVVSVDLDPIAYDGDGVIVVRTDDGERTVRIPARTNLCEAEGLGLAFDLAPGDAVEVRGAAAPDGSVTPCTSPDHRLARR